MRSSLVLAVLVSAACNPTRENHAARALEGEDCGAQADCAGGLVCASDGFCATPGRSGTAAEDADCDADLDCRLGLSCNAIGRCAAPRDGDRGAACRGDGDCRASLVCGQAGECARPDDPGTAPEGEACGADADCAFGLVCGAEGTCTALAPWPGVPCEPMSDDKPRILFEIPRGSTRGDFFRLPYPNDARVTSGVLDLAGFPGLENDPDPAALLGRFASAVADFQRGFGLNSPIFFRFSGAIDFDTLKFGGDGSTFTFVDVTPGGTRRGRRPRSRFFATTDRSRYVCPHWLGLRPSEGSPLDPASTYAVVFRKGIRDARGRLLEADTDFAAVIGEGEPDHPALRAAWSRYAPLRAWLREEGIPVDQVVGGTLFTTGDPVAPVQRLRAVVHEAPAPEIQELTRCAAGVTSPCEAGGERTCGVENERFDEYHARVTLPVFQRGVPPYATRGGDVVQHDGQIRRQRMEPVCVSLTVPRGAGPGRIPLVLYAHDVGGHFRSAIVDGFAARMAEAGQAVLGFDAVLHGPRGGEAPPADAAEAATRLWNLRNPVALRDLPLQAVADLMQLTRFATGAQLQANGQELAFRLTAISFFGHGFGAEVGAIFLALEPDVRAGVLAAGGGDLGERLRTTRAPYPVAAAIAQGLADPEPGGMHPGVALLHGWLDPRDPVNYGDLLRSPPADTAPDHLFLLAGLGDEATPVPATAHLAVAVRAERVGPALVEMGAITEVEGGTARGNLSVRGTPVTRAIKQYAPAEGRDPHRVALELPAATTDVVNFLRGFAERPDSVPIVSP